MPGFLEALNWRWVEASAYAWVELLGSEAVSGEVEETPHTGHIPPP